MCYSAESSLTGFLIGALSSTYLLLSKNKTNNHIGLFFLIVVFIQLAEFFMWSDLECGIYNQYASKSVIPLLTLQILSIYIGAYLFKTTIIPTNMLLFIISGCSIIFIYLFRESFFNKNYYWCSKPNINNTIKWSNLIEIVPFYLYVSYSILMLLFPLSLKDNIRKFILFTLGMLTFITTQYENEGYFIRPSSNSKWCFYSAYIPAGFAILDITKILR